MLYFISLAIIVGMLSKLAETARHLSSSEDYTNMSYYNLCGIRSQHSNISYKKSLVCKTHIVKLDRNKNLTLNRCPLGNYEFKKIEQIRSDSFLTIY